MEDSATRFSRLIVSLFHLIGRLERRIEDKKIEGKDRREEGSGGLKIRRLKGRIEEKRGEEVKKRRRLKGRIEDKSGGDV